jgi:serine/threonine-protein kinase RsbW
MSAALETGTVELCMDAKAENLSLARLAVTGVASRTELSEDAVADLKLAVTEACTNAIEHGYGGGGDGDEILVRVSLEDDRVLVEVQDWGAGHDPGTQAGDSELGLRLIGSLMDELTVTSYASGTLVAFAKQL